MAIPTRWDVQLAHWFDTHFLPIERHRTYARPGRRQAAMGKIPCPSFRYSYEDLQSRTFGLVLDTWPSMDRDLLAEAFDVLMMQSIAHDIPQIRLIFCDKTTYDEGYVLPEHLREHTNIKGLKHPPLQPGIDLLESAYDFPRHSPILLVTDGACDRLNVRREHAFIVPVQTHPRIPQHQTAFLVE
ncbi:MAG: hypothetical protein ABFQ95_08360 [Pseudomonadota bacterium]